MERQDAERSGGSQKSTTSGQNNDRRTTTPGSTTSGRDTSSGQSGYKGSMDENRRSGGSNGNNMLSEIKKTPLLGVLGAVAAGTVLYKMFSGSSSGSSGKTSHGKRSIEVNTKVTVNQPRQEVYDYWRNLENLPNFMSHLEEVNEIDDKTSTWTAKIPGGMGTVEWDAEIVRERTNHLIAWRSLPDSEIENAGEVRFEKDPRGRGTIVETTISYRPPAGEIGEYAAKLFNPAFEKTIKSDLKQFKKIMEKGGRAKRRSSTASRY